MKNTLTFLFIPVVEVAGRHKIIYETTATEVKP